MQNFEFRGKCIDARGSCEHLFGKLICGYLKQTKVDGKVIASYICYDDTWYEVDTDTLDIYFGIKGTTLDGKKNVKVFTGDIVKINYNQLSFDGESTIAHSITGVIGFNYNSFSLIINQTTDGKNVFSSFFEEMSLADDKEVVKYIVLGNKYENADILESINFFEKEHKHKKDNIF